MNASIRQHGCTTGRQVGLISAVLLGLILSAPAAVAEHLASFSVAFFTQGEHLVPVVRDLLDPPGLILSPGRVWSEPGDGGLSRASFPFVLTPPSFSSSYNGLATFLYDDT